MRDRANKQHTQQHPHLVSGHRTLLMVTGLCLGVAWLVGGGTRWQEPSAIAAPAVAKVADDWQGVPPMPRFRPLIFSTGELPKGLRPVRKQKERRAPLYQPLPPASQGNHPILAPETPNTEARQLAARIKRHYGPQGRGTRLLIQTDKPLYQPGESIWFRTAELLAKGQGKVHSNRPLPGLYKLRVELRNPRGAKDQSATILLQTGHGHGWLRLPSSVVGGEYTLSIHNPLTGSKVDKPIVVSQYQAPRIKKKLEFLRKGYGAGDEVQATIALHRATGPVLAKHPLRIVAKLNGKTLRQWQATTNEKGLALLRFRLPAKLQTDDGQLTVLIADAGVTESISRPIPLAVQRIRVGFFPEGGRAVLGLPARYYFAARRSIDQKPIDIAGEIRDQRDMVISTFRSFHDGMGRFRLTPKADTTYTMHITTPKGIQRAFQLPPAQSTGVAMELLDDFRSQQTKLRLVISSHRPQRISITALQHEQLIAHKGVELKEGRQIVVLPLRWQARGIVRLTVWDHTLQPLAERLVFRHRDKGLQIKITPDQKQYGPRGTVTLRMQVKDAQGAPLSHGVLGVSVIDDTVLSYADDHNPHWLAQRFLSSQLTGKLHKPNFYFDRKKPKAWRGLDLIMGTHGWRGFQWQEVAAGTPPPPRINHLVWRTYNQAHFRKTYQRAYKAFIKENQRAHPQPRLLTTQALRQLVATKKSASTTITPEKIDRDADATLPSKKRPAAIAPKPRHGAFGNKKKKALVKRINAVDANRKGLIKKPPVVVTRALKEQARAGKKAGKRLELDDAKAKQKPAKEPRDKANHRFGDDKIKGKLRAPPAPQKKFLAKDMDAGDRLAENKREVMPAQPVMKARRMRGAAAPPAAVGGFAIIQRGPRRWAGRRKLRLDNTGGLVWKARNKRLARIRRERNVRYARWHRWHRQYQTSFRKHFGRRLLSVRSFPTRFYRHTSQAVQRTDFRDTVYWAPAIKTDAQGFARVRFGLNDSITSFRVQVTGNGMGQLGMADYVLASKRPFFMVVKSPIAVSADDAMALPLTLRNDTQRPLRLRVTAQVNPSLKLLEDPLPGLLTLPAGQARTYFYPIRAIAKQGMGQLQLTATAEGIQDSFRQNIQIQPRGFPRHITKAGEIQGNVPLTMDIPLPNDLNRAAPSGEIMLIPAPSTSLLKGLEGMLRMPSGCFEQTSSSNYPNVMILGYLKSRKQDAPALRKRAMDYLQRGYKRLTSYETKAKGFEWFGHAPGHEALTAYGLMQFVQMKKIFPEVDARMIKRTQKWLLSKRDGKGGYTRNRKALDSFGRAPVHITNAYITYALSEAGYTQLDQELQWLQARAKRSKDPYLLSLALNTFLNTKRPKAANATAKQLLSFQQKDGSFHGIQGSITRSGGRNLHIETTALAILGLHKTNQHQSQINAAMEWLRKQNRYGRFGSTQATILALQAIMAYESTARRPKAPGVVSLQINGKVVAERAFQAKTTRPIAFRNFLRWMKPGTNQVQIHLRSKRKLPFQLGIKYFTQQPVTAANTAVTLSTQLQQTSARMGETVRMTVELENITRKGLPMVLARVRYPGALAPQLWQLKQLREQKKVDFIETRPRELILYYRGMAPKAKHTIQIDFVARVTGNYNAAASSAYLYYSDDAKAWSQPLRISVKP